MRIVIIGTGNTATVLGRLFLRSGHEIIQVVGRDNRRAEMLARMLGASFTGIGQQLNLEADLHVMAVTDDAISSVANNIQLDKRLLVHTAGSVAKDVLYKCSKNYGVLYPVQSLRKEMDELPEIPFLVDGNTADNCTLIADFAKTVSSNVRLADDRQRMLTHVAAVMVSNFTNHMYALAQDFCTKEHISFEILLPLIREVANRLYTYSATEVQTGPAMRNDTLTIQKHLSLLQNHQIQQAVYKFLTDRIYQWHHLTKSVG